MKLISCILSILVAFGSYLYFNEQRYALARDVEQIGRRLDYKIERDVLEWQQKDLREMKMKCGKACTKEQQADIDTLKDQIELQKKRVEVLLNAK